MKTFISVVLCLVLVGVTNAQVQPDVKFTPRTLSAGTLMSARTSAAALDDTTQSIRVGGFSAVYVHVVTAANDSMGLAVYYSPSNDGSTFGAWTLIDSLTSTGTVGANKGFAIPAGGMGAEYVRVRVKGTNAAHSSNPSTTVTTIIRKKY